MEKIRILLHETQNNVHIFGITETKLNSDIFDGELSINGYTMIKKDGATE